MTAVYKWEVLKLLAQKRTYLGLGVAMIVLPGPAFVVIPTGLGILAIEFAWARRLLEELKRRGKNVLGRE